jgi:DNA adenine methylase
VSWVGNKAPILGIILALMPLGCDRFVDVFGGSGTVLLGKPPDKFEVYNDFDGDLVNLFRCMKERPLSVIRELGFLSLNSRDDFNVLKRFINQEEFTDEYLKEQMELTEILLKPPEDKEIRQIMKGKAEAYDVRRACAYLKLLRYSYSSGKKSFASQPCDIRRLFHLIWKTNSRLANAVIENQDFETLIRHYDRTNTVFYAHRPMLLQIILKFRSAISNGTLHSITNHTIRTSI